MLCKATYDTGGSVCATTNFIATPASASVALIPKRAASSSVLSAQAPAANPVSANWTHAIF